MNRSVEYRAFEYAMGVLASERIEDFEQLRTLLDTFPHGVDELFGRPWIHNAIDSGSLQAVRWMIDDAVDLAVRDEEGNTPLHVAIQRDLPHKYEILELLLRAGAPVDAYGNRDLTPVDFATALNDEDALQLLTDYGADLPMATAGAPVRDRDLAADAALGA